MFQISLVTFALLSVTCNVHGISDYQYSPRAKGWFKLHKVTATWDIAVSQCESEGSILASPINPEVLNEMMSLIFNNNATMSYFIGTHAKFSPKQYVSIEGVPLEKMPVIDRFQILISENGDCLSSNGFNISVVSCMKYLPYICYKYQDPVASMTECNTDDKEYKLVPSTGSCYKVHRDLRTWPEAYSLCISEGGYLAVINNEHESYVVKNMIPEMKLDYAWGSYWDPLYLGFRDWNNTGIYKSIHGVPMEQLYNVWEPAQPDRGGQLCGAMIRNGNLDNVWCNLKSFFICEKTPIIEERYILVEQDSKKLRH